MSWSAPWARDGACSGCSRAKPAIAATRSCSFGLCFIVHEPSG